MPMFNVYCNGDDVFGQVAEAVDLQAVGYYDLKDALEAFGTAVTRSTGQMSFKTLQNGIVNDSLHCHISSSSISIVSISGSGACCPCPALCPCDVSWAVPCTAPCSSWSMSMSMRGFFFALLNSPCLK